MITLQSIFVWLLVKHKSCRWKWDKVKSCKTSTPCQSHFPGIRSTSKMFFDGEYRSKPIVSLGGRSKRVCSPRDMWKSWFSWCFVSHTFLALFLNVLVAGAALWFGPESSEREGRARGERPTVSQLTSTLSFVCVYWSFPGTCLNLRHCHRFLGKKNINSTL